jgi:hypothetical protein
MIIVKTFVVVNCKPISIDQFAEVNFSGYWGCPTHGEHSNKFCAECATPRQELFKKEMKSIDEYIKIRWNYLMNNSKYDTNHYTFHNERFNESIIYDYEKETLYPLLYSNISGYHQFIDYGNLFDVHLTPKNPNEVDGFIILKTILLELIALGKFGDNAKLSTQTLYINAK